MFHATGVTVGTETGTSTQTGAFTGYIGTAAVTELAMSTFFTNTNEDTCGLTTSDAFSLVTDSDENVAYTNPMFSITNANGLLANAKLVLNQALFADTAMGSGSNLVFKIKYITQVGDPFYA
jgi:hypothetical protein